MLLCIVALLDDAQVRGHLRDWTLPAALLAPEETRDAANERN